VEWNKNKMNIIILTAEPFPIGMACTNPILSYCKEFVDNWENIEKSAEF
jgi:hypothetical protein